MKLITLKKELKEMFYMKEFNTKNIIIYCIFFKLFMITNYIESSVSIPLSQPLATDSQQDVQGLLDNIASNPAVIIDSDTNQLTQVPINRLSHFMLPRNVITMAQKTNLSILRSTDINIYKNYPNGSMLFNKNSAIAQQFDVVINAIKANNELIKFFRKIHFNCLNQIYIYLMKIHTNLIMRHVGSSRLNNGDLAIDINNFITDDEIYATNQKSLIISLLINLIESQFHAMTLACTPQIPYIFATPSGKMLIQNDFATDLSTFVLPQSDTALQQIQVTYLNFLQKYITFFTMYNNLLEKYDSSTGFTQFETVAQNLKTSGLVSHMDPPMFFYDDESMRAIKIIPFIATNLSKKTISIDWAQDAINAATKGIINKNHPVAYFKNAVNEVTKNQSQATHLFVLSTSGDNIFEEELLKQPDWLNVPQKIIGMLQACLGDFSKILSLNIFDPYTQAILEKSLTGSISQLTMLGIQDFSTALTPTKDTVIPLSSTSPTFTQSKNGPTAPTNQSTTK